jgi:hypothetical protein
MGPLELKKESLPLHAAFAQHCISDSSTLRTLADRGLHTRDSWKGKEGLDTELGGERDGKR